MTAVSEAPAHGRCPACGQDNACGMNEAGACWCATQFAPRLPLAAEEDAAACYCRDCLERMMRALPAPRSDG